MKAMFLACLCALAVSCSPFGFNPMGYEVLHEDLDTAWRKVAAMKYIPEDGNYWKSPTEFFRDGGGDCEDFAAALVYLLGTEAKMVRTKTQKGFHFIVLFDETYIEPQTYKKYYLQTSLAIIAIYEFPQVMGWATDYGARGI